MIRLLLIAWALLFFVVSPARAAENSQIFPGPEVPQTGAVIGESGEMLAKRAKNIPRNIPARSDVSSADAVSVLCPGRGALAPLFQAASERYRIRPVVLVAMARVESSCDPSAVNRRTGAVGLLQILPTGSANPDGLSQAELLAPETSIDLGARHLRKLVNLCGTLVGGLGCYHGRRFCRDGRTDGYARKVMGLVGWAKRQLRKLQERRS